MDKINQCKYTNDQAASCIPKLWNLRQINKTKIGSRQVMLHDRINLQVEMFWQVKEEAKLKTFLLPAM